MFSVLGFPAAIALGSSAIVKVSRQNFTSPTQGMNAARNPASSHPVRDSSRTSFPAGRSLCDFLGVAFQFLSFNCCFIHIQSTPPESKDTLAAVNVSGYSGPGLDETVDLNAKLIDQLEEEEEQMTAASEAIENSGLWRMIKKVKVETEDVLLPVPSHYKLVKMPDAKQVSLDFKAATSMYYQGTCIPQEAYLAKHTVARVSQKNYKNIPVGDVVKIERVVRSLDPKDPTNVFVRHGGLQKRMRLQDLSFDV